jgi:Zn-dependent protease/CBS domain-containing protein
MEAQIKLGRLFGVQIGLHYSWLLIATLLTLSLAGHFQSTNPGWSGATVWATALMTAVLFFSAILLHELAHTLVAKSRGLPVRAITLFALGGVAQMDHEAADARTEFWMGIAGPAASLMIGGFCLVLASLLGWQNIGQPGSPVIVMLGWLGYINIALALFNMIPGFPLDGGRVLRAAVWWATGDGARATRIAAATGQIVAFGFILFGLIQFFAGAGLGGLWFAFIGWFLLNAAQASYAQLKITESLRGVRVSDVMSRDCAYVDGRSNIETFVNDLLLRTGRRCFLIAEDGVISGLITPNEVKGITRSRWPYTTVNDAMRPLSQLRTVTPDTAAAEALELLARENIHQLPVVSDGRLEGIVTREHILQALLTRSELDM